MAVREVTGAASGGRVVISVMGQDRVGIVAGIARVLADHNVNILDITQRISSGLFMMLVLADTGRAPGGLERLREALEAESRRLGVSTAIQHERLFASMHRI